VTIYFLLSHNLDHNYGRHRAPYIIFWEAASQ